MLAFKARLGRRITFRKAKTTSRQDAREPAADTLVVAAAGASEARVARAALRWFDATAAGIQEDDLSAAIATGRVVAVNEVLNIEERLTNAYNGAGLLLNETSMQEATRDVFQSGAYAEMEELDKAFGVIKAETKGFGASFQFDVLNPYAVDALRAHGGKLIAEISADTRKAVVDVVVDGFQTGKHPFEQARTIKNMIGLTQQQSRAVGNFQRMLTGEGPQLRQAMRRALRDKRFDKTLERLINEGGLLSHDQITRMTQRYYERYKKYRSEMIARTETMWGSHAGQHELWRQNAAKGLLPEERTRRHWITMPGACPVCLQIPKLNPEGVRLNEQFKVEGGEIPFPPLHPHCRCGVGLKFKREDVDLGALLGLSAASETAFLEKPIAERMAAYRADGARIRTKLLTRQARLTRAELLAAERMEKLANTLSSATSFEAMGGVEGRKALLDRLAKAEDSMWALHRKRLSVAADVLAAKGKKMNVSLFGDALIAQRSKVKQEMIKRAEEAAKFISENVALPDSSKGLTVRVATYAKKGRAYADPTLDMVHVYSNDPISTYVHEMGHILEVSNKEVNLVARQFLRERTAGEELVRLRDATGKNYGSHEVTRKDKFIDPYIGKEYAGTNYTEVVSMSLQYVYENPMKFAAQDSDMFDLMVGLLFGGPK